MLKRVLMPALLSFGLIAVVGCSDDDKGPTDPGTPQGTAVTEWDDAGDFWRTTVNASSYDNWTYFSFGTKDTVPNSSIPKPTADAIWDIAFRREAVKLNGGASTTNSGDAVAMDLGEVTYADVTAADTTGHSWTSDNLAYFIDDWYTYTGPPTHQFIPNRNVYSILDASGHHYVKFQIDSIVGAGAPPNMGKVFITYYYQPTADSRTLPGATTIDSITVGAGIGYYDFSSGSQVTPATPATSTDWDIAFQAYNVILNNDPTGAGAVVGFYAYTELTDPTDIGAFVEQPADAPMFPDIPSSALTDWYIYTGPPLHQLLSNEHVYIVRSGGDYFKLMVESYYENVGGVPTSGWYTFKWNEL